MPTLAEQAGQLLIIGFEGQECGPELRRLLEAVRPGGVIFFQRNIAGQQQFAMLVSELRSALDGTAPFLAIDQEGGEVDRFREWIAPLPSAQEAAQAGRSYELGELAGRELASFGLNVDFAPVLDLGLPESRAVLGSRTAGEQPEAVIPFAREFLRGLQRWSIVGCGKHFPGLGGGRCDSHLVLPTIDKAEYALWAEDLLPYRRLAGQLPMVMVAHAWYPELERALAEAVGGPIPASLSPNIIQGLLRGRIGYRGLVICDDLEMGGVLEGRSIEQAAVAAVRAGCDALLCCRTANHVRAVHTALVAAAESDSAFRQLLMGAASRIRAAKESLLARQQPVMADAAALQQLRADIHTFRETIGLRQGRSADSVKAQAGGN